MTQDAPKPLQAAEPFVCGLIMMALFYLADAVMDAILFGEGDVYQQVLAPTPHELAIRLLAFAVQFLFVFYTWRIFRKRGQQEGALAASREETRQERALAEAILEGISDPISVQSPDFRILYQNRAHRRATGSHLGEYCYRAYHGEEAVCADCHLERSFREGCGLSREVTARTPDGERHAEISSTPLLDGEGRVVAGIEVVRDITGRKQAQAQILALNAELESRAGELAAANEELKAFGYSLSHDLRSPLSHISLAAQGLAEGSFEPGAEENRYFLRVIGNACGKMEGMINAMLVLSRLSQREPRREVVDLGTMAEEIGMALAWRSGRQVSLQVAAGLQGRGDPEMLRMVLENLLENAWKFTGETAAPRIEVGRLDATATPTFFVRDNGAGFDMAQAHRLFAPFQRLHREEEFPGTGIGLATVRRIIQRHGGQVRAEGAPGRGTTLYFTLP